MATTYQTGRGGGAFDGNIMFKSSGNLTKTETVPSSGIKLRGTPVNGLAARVVFPTTPGAAATVLPKIIASVDNSTYRDIAEYPGGALSWASGGKELMIPFAVPRPYHYVKMVFTITGGSTACSYGAVQAGIVVRAHGDWSRKIRWD